MYLMAKQILKKVLAKCKNILHLDDENKAFRNYKRKFYQYTFQVGNCQSYEQYEGAITRAYHTIEKGMAYKNYRAGFGENNINMLLNLMEKYVAEKYDITAFFYETALSVLEAYVQKNADYGYVNKIVNDRIKNLPGKPNQEGGIIVFQPYTDEQLQTVSYEQLIVNRHSIREFSDEPVPVEVLCDAVRLAQYTPSACNRQGWRTRIIADKTTVKNVLSNQNGNRGFTDEIDKLLVVTADLRYFNRDREIHQIFIDGGMYAMRVLDSLNYKKVATIPLSASLKAEQEKNIRKILNIHEAEEFILIIGVGNYPEICQTTKSKRKQADISVY